MPPALFFFLKIALTTHGLLWFHTNFRIVCSTAVKDTIEILTRVALSLDSVFWVVWTFLTVLILPVNEHKISFH